MGIFSQTRTKSLCQFGTFLYVTRAVTSNMMIAHWPEKRTNLFRIKNISRMGLESNIGIVCAAQCEMVSHGHTSGISSQVPTPRA